MSKYRGTWLSSVQLFVIYVSVTVTKDKFLDRQGMQLDPTGITAYYVFGTYCLVALKLVNIVAFIKHV